MFDFDFSILTPETLGVLGEGMLVSLEITAVALVFGVFLGTLLAIMRLSSLRIASTFSLAYVNFFRSVPLAMVLLGFYLVLPQLLLMLPWISPHTDTRMISAMVGFSLFEAAYYSEIIRAGIQSISKGQMAVSFALGMSKYQAYKLIILPQAFRNMTPLLLTQLIILFQDTSVVFIISLLDFFTTAQGIGERDGRLEEMVIVSGLVYFVICFSASMLVKRLSGVLKS